MIYSIENKFPVTTLYFIFPYGNELDPEHKEGFSSIMFEMLDKGTKKRNRKEFDEKLDYLGADINIQCFFDYTTITGEVLTDNFEEFFSLFKEMLFEPGFIVSEFEKLLRLIREELILLRDDDEETSYRLFKQFVFSGTNYGKPTNGTLKSIGNINIDEICKKYYNLISEKNWIIGICSDQGNLVGKLKEIESECFFTNKERIIFKDTTKFEINLLIIKKPNRTQSQIIIGFPTEIFEIDELASIKIANAAFGGAFTSILTRELREKRGLSYGAYSLYRNYMKAGLFFMKFFPSVKNTLQSIEIALDLLNNLFEKGLSNEDIKFGKDFLINKFPFLFETPQQEISLILENVILGRDENFYDKMKNSIETLDNEYINFIIKNKLKKNKLYITILTDLSPEIEKILIDALKPNTLLIVDYQDELI